MPAHSMTPVQLSQFLTNWFKSIIKDPSGKPVNQQTSRPIGTKTYFTSEGDDQASMTKVGGGGDFVEIDHTIGNGTPFSVYADFNIGENQTFLHEGYIQWQGALGDTITLEVVAKATTYAVEASTEFRLYGGYLIVPTAFAGGGTEININTKTTEASLVDADVKLVYIPVSRDSGIRGPAYWNADYNTTTHKYENITSAPAGDGEYMMFGVEIVLDRFVNKMKLIKDGFIVMKTSDTSELGQNMRVKLTSTTNGTDHDWYASAMLVMHRAKTV